MVGMHLSGNRAQPKRPPEDSRFHSITELGRVSVFRDIDIAKFNSF
jgi:hypothetical protein